MPERICFIDGCDLVYHARGWCSHHYGMWRRYGDPLYERVYLTGVPCSIEGCGRPAQGRGWCKTHWARWKKHGDPAYVAATYDQCVVRGCHRKPRSGRAEYCEVHYYRLRRTGTTYLTGYSRTEKRAHRWIAGSCRECGRAYVVAAVHDNGFCSAVHAHRNYVRLRHKRIKTVTIGEPVDLPTLAERDGWRCHVCKRKVTRKNWSVDHLVPLSYGGEHSYANVALAHRRCNSKRHNTGAAQLLLIGAPAAR